MIELNVRTDLKIAMDAISERQRQIIYAAAVALTETGQDVKEAEIHEMRDVFDRPTPYTLNSVFLRRATKNDLRAVVWLKDQGGEGTPADRYLLPQIKGGVRLLKKFELALRQAGLLPDGMIAVPGSGAKLDQYGNMSRGQIVQILAYFRTFGEVGYRANIDDKGRKRLARGGRKRQGFAYFVGRPGDGKLPLGVWQRFHFAVGSAIKPVLLFVNDAHYEPIFDFDFTGRDVVAKRWPVRFRAALQMAFATARRSR